MIKIMSRYKGLILSCMSVMMIVVCVCSFSFESNAAELDIYPEGHTFYLNYPEPTKSETQGYVHVLLYNSDTQNYYVVTYFWTISSQNSDGVPTGCQGMVTLTDETLEFNVYATNNTSGIFYTLYHINATGDYRCVQASSSEKYKRDWGEIYQGDVSLKGWRAGGNAYVTAEYLYEDFTVYYSDDGSSRLLMDILTKLSTMNVQQTSDSTAIWLKVCNILDNTESIDDQIAEIVTYLDSIDGKLIDIDEDLEYLMKRADRMVSLQKDTNTWLEKIWNSIQEFFTPDEEDKEESSKLENESNDKTDKLDDLNEQNKTDKTDIDGASNSVDENIDLESIDNYGKVLAVITENQYILQILLLVFSVALVAYVLFGKK